MNEVDIGSLSAWAKFLGPAVGAVVLIFFIYSRAKSSHLIWQRLWLWLYGPHNVADPDIQRAIRDEGDLARFRFTFNIYVDSMPACKRLCRWAADHGLEMREIAACGRYFDAVQLKASAPARRYWALAVLLTLACAGGILLASFSLASQRALVSFKESRTPFLIDMRSATPVWPLDAQVETAETCKVRSKHASAFRDDERNVLCEILLNAEPVGSKGRQDLDDFVRGALASQRWLLMVAFAGLAFLAYRSMVWAHRIESAWTLSKRMKERFAGKLQ